MDVYYVLMLRTVVLVILGTILLGVIVVISYVRLVLIIVLVVVLMGLAIWYVTRAHLQHSVH
jgi:hypothetical protein